jgi:acyl dehydratase
VSGFKYLEDYEVGEVIGTGTAEVTAEHISEYVRIFGVTNPLFIDSEFGRQSRHASIIAPAPFTLSVFAVITGGIDVNTHVGLAGLHDYRFSAPVRPGDTLVGTAQVLGTILTSSSDQGILRLADELKNQRGEIVMHGERRVMFRRRPR